MVWLIYKDYYRKSLKTSTYIKHLRWYVWVVILACLIMSIGLLYVTIINDIIWLALITTLIALLAGLYFGSEIKEVVKDRVGTYEDIYFHNNKILKEILEVRKIKSKEQIDLLLEQIRDELPNLKTSNTLLKPIVTFTTIIIVPIFMLIVGWSLDLDIQYGILLVISILLLAIMVFGLYYMIKPLLEELLDIEYRKMLKLKHMLIDVKILYYT